MVYTFLARDHAAWMAKERAAGHLAGAHEAPTGGVARLSSATRAVDGSAIAAKRAGRQAATGRRSPHPVSCGDNSDALWFLCYTSRCDAVTCGVAGVKGGSIPPAPSWNREELSESSSRGAGANRDRASRHSLRRATPLREGRDAPDSNPTKDA